MIRQSQMKMVVPSQPILSSTRATRLVVHEWSLFSNSDGEITIHNSFNTEVCGCNFLIQFTNS